MEITFVGKVTKNGKSTYILFEKAAKEVSGVDPGDHVQVIVQKVIKASAGSRSHKAMPEILAELSPVFSSVSVPYFAGPGLGVFA